MHSEAPIYKLHLGENTLAHKHKILNSQHYCAFWPFLLWQARELEINSEMKLVTMWMDVPGRTVHSCFLPQDGLRLLILMTQKRTARAM